MPPSDGSRWYPTIDFDHDVVLWLYPGVAGSVLTMRDLSAIETPEAVTVSSTEGTVGGCFSDSALSWPFAFVELPIIDKPYQLVMQRPFQNCGDGTRAE